MSVSLVRDRRAERTAATRREILDAAWDLVREQGLGELSMRDLGARVGMRAQSLYVYFASKLAIYDAMFGEANQELLERLQAIEPIADPVAFMRVRTRTFLAFATEDLARYQLLFQRTLPGFEPSAESYAPAVKILESGVATLAACGITDPAAMDAFTALVSGLASQQNANDPGGDRWTRLVDDVIDMFLAHYAKRSRKR